MSRGVGAHAVRERSECGENKFLRLLSAQLACLIAKKHTIFTNIQANSAKSAFETEVYREDRKKEVPGVNSFNSWVCFVLLNNNRVSQKAGKGTWVSIHVSMGYRKWAQARSRHEWLHGKGGTALSASSTRPTSGPHGGVAQGNRGPSRVRNVSKKLHV